jgi:hypothetical protein
LIDAIHKIRLTCGNCTNRQYLIACANNANEAGPAVAEFQKAHEDILTPQDSTDVVGAWREVQKTAIIAIWKGIFTEAVAPPESVDLAAFRSELYENLQKIDDLLNVVRGQLATPIFAKFLTQFVKFLIAQVIHSYLKHKIVKDGFVERVQSDCSNFCEFVGNLEYRAKGNHLRTITNLCLFLTEDPGQAFMSYLVLRQEFTDFTPKTAWTLLELSLNARPGLSANKKEIVESFEMQVESVETNDEDHYFSTPAEQAPKSKKGKT